MTMLRTRTWVPAAIEDFVQSVAAETAGAAPVATAQEIARLIAENRAIHEKKCVNLNPATNVMNPRAEAALAAGLGTRPSLGYPGDKYEMGLEAIERIEVIAAELAAEVFRRAIMPKSASRSGALANLYAFMAAGRSRAMRSSRRRPPIGGHVTHHGGRLRPGSTGVDIHPGAGRCGGYTVDVAALREQAQAGAARS